MNGYKCFFNGKSIDVYAENMFKARTEAEKVFKPSKSKAHMISVCLCEKGGEQVTHVATF